MQFSDRVAAGGLFILAGCLPAGTWIIFLFAEKLVFPERGTGLGQFADPDLDLTRLVAPEVVNAELQRLFPELVPDAERFGLGVPGWMPEIPEQECESAGRRLLGTGTSWSTTTTIGVVCDGREPPLGRLRDRPAHYARFAISRLWSGRSP